MSSARPGLPALARRALSAMGRRHLHWCEVCRVRMATRADQRHGRRRPEKEFLFIDAPTRFRGYARRNARYLCDGCRSRNDQAEAARETERQKNIAAATERFRQWLGEAPALSVPLASLEGHEGRLPGDPVFWNFLDADPFVEIMDLEEMVEHLVRDVYGERLYHQSIRLNFEHFDWRTPERMPATYEEAVSFHDRDGGTMLVWKGSVYRLDDGRIVLRWRALQELR